jgi:sulfite reductase beta subunit-like hemoprotein
MITIHEPTAVDHDKLMSFVFRAVYSLVTVPGRWRGSRARASDARIQQLVTSAGFTWFRRAAETPFHIAYEARP